MSLITRISVLAVTGAVAVAAPASASGAPDKSVVTLAKGGPPVPVFCLPGNTPGPGLRTFVGGDSPGVRVLILPYQSLGHSPCRDGSIES